MFDINRSTGVAPTIALPVTQDAGLRAHMLSIYNWMCSGLLVTAITAYLVSHTSLGSIFYQVGRNQRGIVSTHPTMLGFLAMFSPLIFTLIMTLGFNRMSKATLSALFWAFSATMGVSMASVFVLYVGTSIASTFFVTAGMFAATSMYGYTTGADLTKMGSLLIMALFGIILATIVNIFLGSTMLQMAIGIIGVLVFTGLTAYDTQRIKNNYLSYGNSSEIQAKMGVLDALSLYLNFINLFQFMLQFMGVRRSD